MFVDSYREMVSNMMLIDRLSGIHQAQPNLG